MKPPLMTALILGLLFTFSAPLKARAQAAPAAPGQASATPSSASPKNTDSLVQLLKSDSPSVRARAARDLGQSHDLSAVPALAGALKDPNDKVRREVVIALAQMHSPEVLDALVTASKDYSDDLRTLAVQCLVGYYTGQIPSPGFTGFMKKSWERAKGHFTPDTTRIDPGLTVDPKVVTALDDTMQDARSVKAARQAAKGLGILVAQAAVPDLVKAAHTSDENLAREALNALSKIKDRSAGPPLVDLLDSPNKNVKRDASVTVGILRANEALPKLQTLFENDPDAKDKESAIEGLAYLGQSVSVPLFTKALWSNDKPIRASAAEGLARVADPTTLPEVERAIISERDQDVKLAMMFAITALGKQDYLSQLVSELSSKTRGEVVQAYLIELARTPGFLLRLYPYLQSQDAGVRARLCTVLMYAGDATSLEALDRLSHDPNGEVASESLRAKRAIRARTATAPQPAEATKTTP